MPSPTITDRFKRLVARATGRKAQPERKDGDELPTDDSNDPQTLAAKIRNIIDVIPIPSGESSRTIPSPRKPPAHDKSGKPILPPGAARTKDEELITNLSSATIMNGKRTNRESVWSILDSLGAPKHDTQNEDDSASDTATLDDSSVMMYSPLVPAADSVVELAETQLVPSDAAHTPQTPAFQTLAVIQSLSWWPPKFWPFTAWNHDDNDKTNTPSPVRVWVPSTTKLSFQIMWWGYRIYLPPPILAILNDKQLEAAKRAAMITTALTWFFGHIPITSLPPTIQPAVLLLQKLVPFVGYIGTFISWSWSTIKSYDVGYGVYLTATWILPVALIPGTWQSYDFPSTPSKTPVPNTPAPATGTPTPAGPSSTPANGT